MKMKKYGVLVTMIFTLTVLVTVMYGIVILPMKISEFRMVVYLGTYLLLFYIVSLYKDWLNDSGIFYKNPQKKLSEWL